MVHVISILVFGTTLFSFTIPVQCTQYYTWMTSHTTKLKNIRGGSFRVNIRGILTDLEHLSCCLHIPLTLRIYQCRIVEF